MVVGVGAPQKFDVGVLASAVEWWRDAGVDVLVDDAPRDWLTDAAPARAAPPAEPVADELPTTWEAFSAWRSGSGAPEAGWSGVSLAASGPVNAEVMVLVDCPDVEDARAGLLLSGDAGRLFDRMLAAIGLARSDIHLAAVCAKRPIGGRMPPETRERLAEIARRHVELIAPKRLLLLGDATSRAVLAMDQGKAAGGKHVFQHRTGETSVVASHHPRRLLQHPTCKAESWRDLRLLMGAD